MASGGAWFPLQWGQTPKAIKFSPNFLSPLEGSLKLHVG